MANNLTTDTPQHLPALPAHLEAKIKLRWNSEYDKAIGASHTLTGEDRMAAWKVVTAQLAPCGERAAAAQLAPLFATLAGRNRGAVDVKVLANAMSGELGKLPGDLVAKAASEWFVSSKWHPTPVDLIDLMEPELSKRRAILKALETPHRQENTQPPPSTEPHKVSDKAQAILDSMRRQA